MKSATTSTALLQLGNKWRLSGTGDKFHDDDWLRLMNIDNTGYYGGLAVKKLWTPKAFNHVLQLGTKWRLSGVGDKMQDDDWLRLMDIQNTKLYGGFAAAKMQTQNMEVKGLARVKYLEVASRYRLVGTLDTLQVKNDKDNALAKLQASHLKSDTLNVLRSGLLNSVHVTKTASVNRLE